MLLAGAKRLTELSPAITHANEHTSSGEDEGGPASGSVSQEYEYGGGVFCLILEVQAVPEGSARAIWAGGLTKEPAGDVEKNR